MMGRPKDAHATFERAASTQSDLGLQRQLGNFPQAFSHFALVNAAFTLAGEPTAI
jgi:GH15 family glucan-1,4-alpha-glucosidase